MCVQQCMLMLAIKKTAAATAAATAAQEVIKQK